MDSFYVQLKIQILIFMKIWYINCWPFNLLKARIQKFAKTMQKMCQNSDTCFVFIFRCDVITRYGIDRFCAHELAHNVNIFEHGGHVSLWVYRPKDPIPVDLSKQELGVVTQVEVPIAYGTDRTRTTGKHTWK